MAGRKRLPGRRRRPQAPPLFGQGLCSGLRDVANLVWKLRLVSQGLAAEELLDTYESERRPHARYWVEKAASMAGLMQTTDPETAAGRDAYIRANPVAAAPPGAPPLGPGLHTGPGDERAGRLSVQSVLPDGRRLDDLVGVRFLLAATPELLEAVATEVRAAVDADPETVVLTDAGRSAPCSRRRAQPPWWCGPTATSSARPTLPKLEALLRLVPTTSLASGAAAPVAAGA